MASKDSSGEHIQVSLSKAIQLTKLLREYVGDRFFVITTETLTEVLTQIESREDLRRESTSTQKEKVYELPYVRCGTYPQNSQIYCFMDYFDSELVCPLGTLHDFLHLLE